MALQTITLPLSAATVLVIRASWSPASPTDDIDDDIEVLLVRRSHRASFMANAYVFPGGRVDAADAVAATNPTDSAAVAQAAGLDLATRRAAARELAEEVSLQVGELEQLVPFAHWITPSAEPKRFDTAFFLWPLRQAGEPSRGPIASAPDAPQPEVIPEVKVDGREVFDPLWITPAAALTRYAQGLLNLPPPTACTLEDLAAEIAAARRAVVAEPRTASGDASVLQTLLTRCAVRRPLPVLPKFFAEPDGGLAIVMPWDAQYPELPGDGAPVPALAAGAAAVPGRIRRCQLKRVGPDPRPGNVVRPADQTAGADATFPGASIVPWTVERMPT